MDSPILTPGFATALGMQRDVRRRRMVLSCIVDAYKQAQRIRRGLAGLTVYEEKISDNEVVISVRVQTASEIERVRQIFKAAGVEELSEFAEAA